MVGTVILRGRQSITRDGSEDRIGEGSQVIGDENPALSVFLCGDGQIGSIQYPGKQVHDDILRNGRRMGLPQALPDIVHEGGINRELNIERPGHMALLGPANDKMLIKRKSPVKAMRIILWHDANTTYRRS